MLCSANARQEGIIVTSTTQVKELLPASEKENKQMHHLQMRCAKLGMANLQFAVLSKRSWMYKKMKVQRAQRCSEFTSITFMEGQQEANVTSEGVNSRIFPKAPDDRPRPPAGCPLKCHHKLGCNRE